LTLALNPGAIGAANEIADRVEGKSRQQIEVNDITHQLREKSDDELRRYLQFGSPGLFGAP